MTVEIERYELLEDPRYRFAFDSARLHQDARRRPPRPARRASPRRPGEWPRPWHRRSPAGGRERLAPHRRDRRRDGIHRQGRSRAEHPHVAHAGRRRRAARAARVHLAGDGRHEPCAVRHGHLRQPHDADDEPSVAPGGGGRAESAGEHGRRSAGKSTPTASTSSTAASSTRPRIARRRWASCSAAPRSSPPSHEAETLAAPSAWHVAGRSVPKIDGRAFVTGTHEYTSDIRRPGMGHGRVDPAAEVRRDDRIGRLTGRRGAARRHRRPRRRLPRRRRRHDRKRGARRGPVKVTWAGGGSQSSTTLFDDLKSTAESGGGQGGFHAGDVDAALASGSRRFEASYRVAYIAHCPLEPRAAVAEWSGDDVTVWTGTQRPFGVQGELAEAFHLAPERVRVIDAGHRIGLRRQAHRRRGDRGRASRARRAASPCRSCGRETKS